MKFYCVSVEFYDYGKVLACVTESGRKEKPNQQFRRVCGLTAFKIWFANEAVAIRLLAGIENGEFDLDYVQSLYSVFNEYECQQKEAA